MAATLDHVRGDNFRWVGTRTDAAGDPVNVTGAVTARFVNAMGAEIVLTGEALSGNTFELVADADVAATWVPGLYKGDIEFTVSGLRTSTRERVQLLITQDYANAT